jgi:hypothetical protein
VDTSSPIEDLLTAAAADLTLEWQAPLEEFDDDDNQIHQGPGVDAG